VPFMWVVVLGTPHALMVLAGALLWKRYRSVASIMIASGSAATLAVQVSVIFVSPGIGAAGLPLLVQYVGQLGFWLSAAGCVWHAKKRPTDLGASLTIVGREP
jgi:hypothetical protein